MPRKALVVSVSKYSKLYLGNFPSFANNANAIANVLRPTFTVRCLPEEAVQEGERVQVGKESVSLKTLQEQLKSLFTASDFDTVLFYFSGHGLLGKQPYPKTYLATSESEVSDDGYRKAIEIDLIKSFLRDCPAREQIVWLDCCYGGDLASFTEVCDRNDGKTRFIITASRSQEPAHEEIAGEMGVFTRVLVEALARTGATERRITCAAIEDVVREKLQSLHYPQMPQFYRTPNKIIEFWDRRVMTQENQADLKKYSSDVDVLNEKGTSQTGLSDVSAGRDINVENITQNIIHNYPQPSSKQTTSTNPVNSSGNQNGDQIYIERPTIEKDCYEAIEYARLIRIKAPPGMGKTWLLNKIIEYAKEKKHYSIVEIDIDEDILIKGDYIGFLKWFCKRLSDSLNFARVSWDKDNGNKLNVINHIISILSTSRVDSKLIITISNFEVLFEFPDIFRKFCELVRGWVDSNDRSLRKLSVIIVHSTEPYIRYNINSSPFGNVGKPFELLGFTNEQVKTLANRLRLESLVNNHPSEIKQLQKFVNGHPELITKALECIKNGDDIQDILKDASTEGGIFGGHLRDKQNNLRQKTNLLEDYKKIVVNYCEPNRTSTKLDSNLIFQLYGLGLVKYDGNGCWPSCELYHSYFYDILIKNKQ